MKNNASKELFFILKKASENKIYGSVEVYFESGIVTQITQRIIKKISKTENSKKSVNIKLTKPESNKHPHSEEHITTVSPSRPI